MHELTDIDFEDFFEPEEGKKFKFFVIELN